MILLLFFFCSSLFCPDALSIKIVNQSAPYDILISTTTQKETQKNDINSLIAKAKNTQDRHINVAIKDFDMNLNGSRKNYAALNQASKQITELTDIEKDFHSQLRLAKRKCLGMITAQTQATSFFSSLAVLLLAKFCYKNAVFLLAASLTLPYWHDYDYFKKKNRGPIVNKVVDFVFACIISAIMLRLAFY